jgi:simple sugar transport system permease protein
VSLPDAVTTFGLTPGGFLPKLPDWVLPSQLTLNLLAIASGTLGVIQIARRGGFRRRTNLVLGIVAGMFIFGFLVWAAAGKSLNLAGLLSSTLLKAVPLTLGALSGVLCERAGVVNIAIEGMMLMAAMVGALVGSVTNNLWVGLVAGRFGGILGLVHGVLSIKYKTNQIISGTVINIFSIGFTSYISAKLCNSTNSQQSGHLPAYSAPFAFADSFFGPILFDNNIFVYGMYLFLVILHIALFFTRWGLRHRSVENTPRLPIHSGLTSSAPAMWLSCWVE